LDFENPFRPGAGHKPPYLAGRSTETGEIKRLLGQRIIMDNMVLTGLRGVGKTVLLETLKPIALEKGWLWVGADMSESTSLSEENIATRLCADLALITASIPIAKETKLEVGFTGSERERTDTLSYDVLISVYKNTPGLAVDKIKKVIEQAWAAISNVSDKGTYKGIVFSYDEAQNLSDHAQKDAYPLSLLLDSFQSLQRSELPVMLVLTGLPTLFPKLVEARTYAERMFRVVTVESLTEPQSREAILRPIEDEKCPVALSDPIVSSIIKMSGGYPYFIQFICREIYDISIQLAARGEKLRIPVNEIEQKLDSDFFAGRWARATDRQRELLWVIAHLDNCDSEFTVQEITAKSENILTNKFSSSHVNQMLTTLSNHGLVFKNRHGRYSLAVPLLNKFILRQNVNSSHA